MVRQQKEYDLLGNTSGRVRCEQSLFKMVQMLAPLVACASPVGLHARHALVRDWVGACILSTLSIRVRQPRCCIMTVYCTSQRLVLRLVSVPLKWPDTLSRRKPSMAVSLSNPSMRVRRPPAGIERGMTMRVLLETRSTRTQCSLQVGIETCK